MNLLQIDPYSNTPEDELVRLQSRVDHRDYNFLRNLTATRGCVQAFTNRLIRCFVATLQNHGISDYTDSERIELILNTQFPVSGLRDRPADVAPVSKPKRTTRPRA